MIEYLRHFRKKAKSKTKIIRNEIEESKVQTVDTSASVCVRGERMRNVCAAVVSLTMAAVASAAAAAAAAVESVAEAAVVDLGGGSELFSYFCTSKRAPFAAAAAAAIAAVFAATAYVTVQVRAQKIASLTRSCALFFLVFDYNPVATDY